MLLLPHGISIMVRALHGQPVQLLEQLLGQASLEGLLPCLSQCQARSLVQPAGVILKLCLCRQSATGMCASARQ